MTQTTKATPWGASEFQHRYSADIVFHSTAGHGGFEVGPESNAKIAQEYRFFAAYWSKGWYDGTDNAVGWYEEDVAGLAVVLTFPELFPHVDNASLKKAEKYLGEALSQSHFDKE